MNSKKLWPLSFLLFLFPLLSSPAHTLQAQNNCVQFDIIGGTAAKGDCIWVPVRVYNFDTILAVQFGLAYDPLVVMPVAKWANSTLIGLDTTNNINFDQTRKIVRFLWSNPNADCSGLVNGDTLIMIKFKLVGEPGSCNPITFFDRSPIDNEVLDCNADDYCFEEINPQDNDICIGQPVDLCVITYTCGTFSNSGSITIKPFGGAPPYIVDKISPAPPQTDTLQNSGDCVIYNNLLPGSYQFRVTDGNGNDTLVDLTVGLASPITIAPVSIRNPRCWNTTDGEINIRITGGSGGLLIGWSPIDFYGTTLVNKLPVGNYTVTVRDTAGCVAQETFTLFADTLYGEVQVQKDASCADDGIVVARARGGNPCPPAGSYCFFWSQNVAANVCDTVGINNKMSGNQFVIIEDCRGCRDTQYFEVKFSGELLSAIAVDSLDCYGDTNASFQAIISSLGVLNIPVSFRLTDQNNNLVFGGVNGVDRYSSPNLRPGQYFLEVTDNAGCKRRDTIVITEPPRLEIIDINIDTFETCIPGQDAFIQIRGFGGTPGYLFNWSNMASGSSISGLSQGRYTVTLTDQKGCTVTKSYNVIQPNGPRIDSFLVVRPACPGETTGSLEVLYTPGAAPVNQFSWNVPGTGSRLTNLGTGWYIVTIRDTNGCTATDSFQITPSGNAIQVSAVNLRDPLCNGTADGFVLLTVNGGQMPYTYLWNNGNQTNVNTNLKAGQYCVTIDDVGGCPALDTCFVLTDPPKTQIQLSNITAPSCATAGSCDGSASLIANGRDPSYTITWSSGEQVFVNQDTATGLCSGQQFVIVTNGFCSDTFLFDVPQAIPITIDSTALVITPPRCYGSNDGSISIRAKGGTGPYEYRWVNPAVNSPLLSNLGDGHYFVNIVDANNCVHLDSIRLREPDSIRVDIIMGASLDVSCPGRSDGRIATAWTGGNKGKGQFSWAPNIGQDSIANNIPAGSYTLLVTDFKGCTGTASYTVREPSPIMATLTAVDTPKCAEDEIQFSVLQATGGAGPVYKFTVNNGAPQDLADLVPLGPGQYSVRIYDRNNCFLDTFIQVRTPNSFLSLDFGISIDTVRLGDSIFLDGKLPPGTVIDTLLWNPSATVRDLFNPFSFVSPNRNTTYTLTVIDENGCVATDQVTIIVRNIREFYAPNVFSPNGDGINDFLTFHAGKGVRAIRTVQVFDRWGNKVYQVDQPSLSSESVDTWNGRPGNNGDLMNPGVFVYYAEVEFQDGSVIQYRGDLTLLR